MNFRCTHNFNHATYILRSTFKNHYMLSKTKNPLPRSYKLPSFFSRSPSSFFFISIPLEKYDNSNKGSDGLDGLSPNKICAKLYWNTFELRKNTGKRNIIFTSTWQFYSIKIYFFIQTVNVCLMNESINMRVWKDMALPY